MTELDPGPLNCLVVNVVVPLTLAFRASCVIGCTNNCVVAAPDLKRILDAHNDNGGEINFLNTVFTFLRRNGSFFAQPDAVKK